jgi:hypothetical protein
MRIGSVWGDALRVYRRSWWSMAWRGVVTALALGGAERVVDTQRAAVAITGLILIWLVTFSLSLDALLDGIGEIAGTGGSPRAARMFAAAWLPMFIPPFTILLPTLALENCGVLAGIRRSWQLTRGSRLRSAAALLLVPATLAAALAIITVVSGDIVLIVFLTAPALILPLVVPLFPLVQTSMYVALHGPVERPRGELLEAVVLRRGLAAGSAAGYASSR